MSESALSLAKQLSELLLLEFEALKVQDLDRFEALQPGKNELLAGLSQLCPSAEDLQNLPEFEDLKVLFDENVDSSSHSLIQSRFLATFSGSVAR